MAEKNVQTIGELTALVQYLSNAMESGDLDEPSIDALKQLIDEQNQHEDYRQSVKDAWGNECYVEQKDGVYVIGSNGPDGTRGNEDDLILNLKSEIIQGKEYVEVEDSMGVMPIVLVLVIIGIVGGGYLVWKKHYS